MRQPNSGGMNYGQCYFLDVGQGTANVVLLSGRRALVLDAGPIKKASPVHRLLKKYAGTIECVLLSHHDKDHILGWEQIAADFQKNIGAVWCVPDANPEEGRRIDITMKLSNEGKIPRPSPAMVDSLKVKKTIWKDSQSPLQLDVYYPDLQGVHEAIKAGNKNGCSVVAALGYNNEVILFPGDCQINAWRRLRDESPHLPLQAKVVNVPHHGGLPGGTPDELTWLYKQAVQSRVAVVSAGSANDEGHPTREVITALRDAGVRIMCTQITPACQATLEPLRPGVIPPLAEFSASTITPSFTSTAQRSRNVGCAGTVRASLGENAIQVLRQSEHLAAVTKKVSSPMCC